MDFPPKLSESTHQWVFQAWETYAKSTGDLLYCCTNHTALGYTKPHPPKPFLQLLPLLKKAQISEECVWSEFILLCSLRALMSTILPHPGPTQKKACHVMNEYILAEQPQSLIKQRFKLKMQTTSKPTKDVYYFITLSCLTDVSVPFIWQRCAIEMSHHFYKAHSKPSCI